MAVQLPSEAVGYASGILAYSLICLACSSFMLWLVWAHDERKSYVMMLAFFTTLSTLASIIQQIHTIALWKDVKTAQYEYQKAHVGNPELNIAGNSTGLDLVLFYIQFYCYNVEAMLVLFWSAELARSVFRLRSSAHAQRVSIAAKTSAVLLPVIQVNLLRTSAVQSTTAGFLVLANFIMIISLVTGSILLLLILVKYIHARHAFLSWNVRYGQSSEGTQGTTSPGSPIQHKNIYDRWLVVRFAIAFVALGAFELVIILFELHAMSDNKAANIPAQPDLSAARAKADFANFAPGVSASLLTFVVFGTTRTFREHMWALFIPKRLRERIRPRRPVSIVVPSASRQHLRGEDLAGSPYGMVLSPNSPQQPSPTSEGVGLQDLDSSSRTQQQQQQQQVQQQGNGKRKGFDEEWLPMLVMPAPTAAALPRSPVQNRYYERS
ncbi:glycoside hydrolase [Diplogelasinospora grovesii]|uniref:Glycoside hydrolase n=1 Tax=Diplogelasinospora grovesii TaxID=303347 RepID=A0AAN6S4N7_9PEZI|nr:glycoside hydrolase [Diplogelasinospora grovesii]